MKSLLLLVLAIGVPFGLMLLVNWATSSPAPQPVPNAAPTAARAVPPRPAEPIRKPPISLVPANGMQPMPSPHELLEAPVPAAQPSAAMLAHTASAPAVPQAAPSVADRIESWLEDWQLRTRQRPDSQREEAAAALAHGNFQRAAVAFDRLLLKSPNDADLTLGEVMALTRLGRHEDALPLLTALLERDPRNTAARFHQGVTLMRLDRREAAIETFTQLLDTRPDHEAAMYNVAVLQQSLGRRQEAWTAWRSLTDHFESRAANQPSRNKAPTAAPTSGQPPAPPEGALSPDMICAAWFHRGEAEMVMSQIRPAQKCFKEVTRRAPDDARAWCNLGIAHATLAEYDEALPALHEALRLEPALVAAMNQIAYIHAERFRATRQPEDCQAVLDWCQRSLAVRSQQPNLYALIDAVRATATQPDDETESTEAASESFLSPIHAGP